MKNVAEKLNPVRTIANAMLIANHALIISIISVREVVCMFISSFYGNNDAGRSADEISIRRVEISFAE
ncbi:MAG TPA: hypothetical protein VJB66_03090 [Candidatus Nanoarchaeia archaeon]|nr:hypothetical protein [Candidatus Nanoarchaeia archaeon]